MKLTEAILRLPRFTKRLIALTADVAMCLVSVWFAFYLRTGVFHALHPSVVTAMAISVAVAVPIFIVCGLYRAVFRYEGFSAAVAIILAMSIYTLIYVVIFTVIGVSGVPRTVGFIQPAVLIVLVALSRGCVRLFLSGEYQLQIRESKLPRVIVYGAGNTGRQLLYALESGRSMRVAAFVDDDRRLQGCLLGGIKIYPPRRIPALLRAFGTQTVLLAIPSASRARRREIVDALQACKAKVRTVPSYDEIVSGKVAVNSLRELEIDELLGRDPVEPKRELLARTVEGKTVMVTGAGGSIGSELCRQIIRLNPTRLLLAERSEFAVYHIYHELIEQTAQGAKVDVVPLLADVTDERRMREIMQTWKPQTVYHAAAYKHVPMVEHNPLEGVENNVFGTMIAARAARDAGVEDFVLISTDKAVRPTNVMGATKRMAELVLQAMAHTDAGHTIFTMVRFGNVLGSSGSVVPRFREQIRSGGPVTLTHPDIVRYFMTIPEASQLVLQAASLGRGGDVFLLDMGKPVKIYDLAVRMIALSGLTLKDKDHPAGDIEIKITGLRPGEKLYEELLIGDNPEKTEHPRIFRAVEKSLPMPRLKALIGELAEALARRDRDWVLRIMREVVPEFSPKDGIGDWVLLYEKKQEKRMQQALSASGTASETVPETAAAAPTTGTREGTAA